MRSQRPEDLIGGGGAELRETERAQLRLAELVIAAHEEHAQVAVTEIHQRLDLVAGRHAVKAIEVVDRRDARRREFFWRRRRPLVPRPGHRAGDGLFDRGA